jgi:hypothetical protein
MNRIVSSIVVAALVCGACQQPTEETVDSGEPGADAGPQPIPEGPAHVCQSPPSTARIARLDEAFGTETDPQLSTTFYAGGALRTVGDVECTPGMDLPNPHVDRARFIECWEDYTCGDCPFWVGVDETADGGPRFYLLGEFPDDPSAVRCSRHLGIYEIIDPDAVTQPATDNRTPRPGGNDACSDCLASCQHVPGSGCCTGQDCLCESACTPAPSDCPSGTRFCCGPYGGCICTANCPY